MNKSNNKRIKSFDFIRVIATLGVFLFHFSCHVDDVKYAAFLRFGYNAGMGDVCVTIFFILSGFLLHHYEYDTDVKVYFYKRWKGIYPIFYFTFIIFWIMNIPTRKEIWYSNHFWLSILGMDGYFNYLSPNYYLIGEWFVGAIVFLYILFIPIRLLNKKFRFLPFFLILCMYIWLLIFNPFKINEFRNVITCLFSFSVGIYIDDLNILENKYIHITSFFLLVILLFIRMPYKSNVYAILLGISLFFVLNYTGNKLMQFKIAEGLFNNLGKLSFAFYLLHHRIITMFMSKFQPTSFLKLFLMMFLIMLFIIYLAEFIYLFNDHFLKGSLIRILDKKIYKKEV